MSSVLQGLDLEHKSSKEAGIVNFIRGKKKTTTTQWPPLAEGGGEKSI